MHAFMVKDLPKVKFEYCGTAAEMMMVMMIMLLLMMTMIIFTALCMDVH